MAFIFILLDLISFAVHSTCSPHLMWVADRRFFNHFVAFVAVVVIVVRHSCIELKVKSNWNRVIWWKECNFESTIGWLEPFCVNRQTISIHSSWILSHILCSTNGGTNFVSKILLFSKDWTTNFKVSRFFHHSRALVNWIECECSFQPAHTGSWLLFPCQWTYYSHRFGIGSACVGKRMSILIR